MVEGLSWFEATFQPLTVGILSNLAESLTQRSMVRFSSTMQSGKHPSDIVLFCFPFQCGSDVQHTVNAITAYLTWIGLARGQTSTSLKQCGTMLMDNGTMSFKKSGDLFWRAQAVLKKKGGPTKSGLSSLLELFKLFKIIAAPFSHFPTKI